MFAYCVLSHRLPDQVLRLARTLRAESPGCRVLIHHDPQGPRLDRTALDAVGGVRQLRPVGPVAWGRGSQLDALLALVTAAVDTGAEWVVLLSGQDHPARPLADVEADLLASELDGHVDGHLVPPPDGDPDEFQRRYFYRWRPVPVLGPARRLAAPLAPRVLLRDLPGGTTLAGRPARHPPFSPELPCRRGQDWLTLRRPAAEALVRAAREWPGLVDHYRATVLPTESFPHTVLHAERGLRLSGDSRRYVVFPDGSPHPRDLEVADAPAIAASGADFARKFAGDAARDALDAARGAPAR